MQEAGALGRAGLLLGGGGRDLCRQSGGVLLRPAQRAVSPAVRREPGQWAFWQLFGGFDFLQYIALDPAGRKREDIAVAWIRRLTAAIRAHDQDTLITVGLLPWSRQWQHLSGFLPAAIAPELDFVSVHMYPDSKLPGEALEACNTSPSASRW